jgi:hypothetical protein
LPTSIERIPSLSLRIMDGPLVPEKLSHIQNEAEFKNGFAGF